MRFKLAPFWGAYFTVFWLTCGLLTFGNLNGNSLAVDLNMLKGIQDLGSKPAVCLKGSVVPLDINLADPDAPASGNIINLADQLLGHYPLPSTDIQEKASKFLIAVRVAWPLPSLSFLFGRSLFGPCLDI